MRIKKSRVIRNRWAPVYLCAPVTLAGQKETAGRSEGGFFLLFLNVVFELANKRADRPNEWVSADVKKGRPRIPGQAIRRPLSRPPVFSWMDVHFHASLFSSVVIQKTSAALRVCARVPSSKFFLSDFTYKTFLFDETIQSQCFESSIEPQLLFTFRFLIAPFDTDAAAAAAAVSMRGAASVHFHLALVTLRRATGAAFRFVN